ncbi:MAG: SUMF1/EgtB/PvdO family nonheme iron enzyme, partial [Chloroflexota bacterium]
MRKFVTTLLVLLILTIIVAYISLSFFPEWLKLPGGVLLLISGAFVTITKLGPSIKDWKELIFGKEENPKSDPGVSLKQTGDNNRAANHDYIEKQVHGDYVENKVIVNPPPPPSKEEKLAEEADTRLTYLKNLRRKCLDLPLTPVGGSDEDITLDQVYVNLDTTDREEAQKKSKKDTQGRPDENPPISALKALEKKPYLVILGDPGSGKSAFVRYVFARQASVLLGDEKEPYPGIDPSLLPVLVNLRDLAQDLKNLDLSACSGDVRSQRLTLSALDFILKSLQDYQALPFKPSLEKALEDGNCLLAFDGLDEVPQDLRLCTRQAVGAVLKAYKLKRVIVTCRIRSYVNEAVFSSPFQSVTLASLDKEKIEHFCKLWYQSQLTRRFTQEQVNVKSSDFSQAAQDSDLRDLSANPLMLTAMALVHQKETKLPKQKVVLYKKTIEMLLLRWQKHKSDEESLDRFIKDENRIFAAMERLAYEAHTAGKGKDKEADLERGIALGILEQKEYLGDPGLAGKFLDYVDLRAGLLVGRGGDILHPSQYSFPHRTFQEYLAGCYVLRLRNARTKLFELASEGDYWNVAVQMGAEDLYYNHRAFDKLIDLAYSLCPVNEKDSDTAKRALIWSGLIAALLGQDEILMDDLDPDGGKSYLERVLQRLQTLMLNDISVPLRVEAGNTLSSLGDLRFNPDFYFLPCDGNLGFIHIPAGPFLMGSDKSKDSLAQDDELPQHTVTLKEYWIAKYPVTVA